MPPKVKVTKEDIINKAYSIVKEQGVATLSARLLAHQLDCSTQPIYKAFTDMSDLQAELAKKAAVEMSDYISQEFLDGQPAIISQVLGYLRFAHEMKNLYQLMYTAGSYQNTDGSSLFSAADPVARDLLIYAHGILFLREFETLPFTWDEIRELVLSAYNKFLHT